MSKFAVGTTVKVIRRISRTPSLLAAMERLVSKVGTVTQVDDSVTDRTLYWVNIPGELAPWLFVEGELEEVDE